MDLLKTDAAFMRFATVRGCFQPLGRRNWSSRPRKPAGWIGVGKMEIKLEAVILNQMKKLY
jgi:hypothetical protein